jgi:hypothetical protein
MDGEKPMNAKAASSSRVRQHYLVQFTIEAAGRDAADAIQHALDQMVRDGLHSADVRAEAIPTQKTASAALTVAAPTHAGTHGSHDEFHGLFLG